MRERVIPSASARMSDHSFQITTIMASAADIRSVLSVPDPTPGSSQQPQKKPTATSRRPQGISRELYELIGDSVPSVVPQQSKARLKLKPNLGSGPPRSRWCVYSNVICSFDRLEVLRDGGCFL